MREKPKILSDEQKKPWERENWREAKGIIASAKETNSALAKRDYSVKCECPSQNKIAVINGYWFWWCTTHHQPLALCEKGRAVQQAKAEVAREMGKQFKAEHKRLEELSRASFIFLRRLDEVMANANGNPIEAGKTIASLANILEMANDKARYFHLGIDYRKDDKDKEWQSLKSKYGGQK